MTIAVFGAGAVGSFFGALLARGGEDVRFVARGAQLDAITADGIRIRSLLMGDVHVGRLRAHRRAADVGVVDLVLVCVKANQTASIVGDVATLVGPTTSIVTMQNGVDSDEVLAARFGRAVVLPAVVYVGATVDAPGTVTHVAAGTIVLGGYAGGDPARLEAVRAALAASGQPVRVVDDIQLERWRKLIWNASFNTVSALTARAPRELLAEPEARALVVRMMHEVVAVGRAAGVALRDEDVQTQMAWTEKAQAIRTSMMVDRERDRAMETEALIGVIVRRAREHGISVPCSEAIYALLKAMEAPPLPEARAAWVPPPQH
jgi:2-dehydropantoate 2-reductase